MEQAEPRTHSVNAREELVPCADEGSAREEAARQQAAETGGAEWLYLRVDGQWVARRYVKEEAQREKMTWRERLASASWGLLDPSTWY